MKRLLSALVVLLPVLVDSVSAQSLADVARKEEQRRKDRPKPAKVYTNDDLGTVPPLSTPPPAATPGETAAEPDASGPEPAAAPPAEGAPAADGAPVPADDDDRGSSAASFRAKLDAAHEQLERSRMFAEALQTRVNSLWADFTARDDPAQRSRIETDRQKALAELDRVKKDIVAQTKAVADIEEQARRAGVPPGSLR
jgi:hypothetical protein